MDTVILTPRFHWMRVRYRMAALRVHLVLCHLSIPTSCVSERSTANSFTVIKISHATTVSENLWSVDFRPSSHQYDVLLVLYSEIWSAVNTEVFFFWKSMFNFVSVPNFLSRTICSVLNCCIVLWDPAKTEVLGICCGGLRITGVGTQRSRSQWNHTHWLELEHRRNIHASGGT